MKSEKESTYDVTHFEEKDGEAKGAPPTADEMKSHTEIQWMLLRLGTSMGLDVWVPKDDRNQVVEGHRFADVLRLRDGRLTRFHEETNGTMELIDVLWLEKNGIMAAFEIETTTSDYPGLLRMADLIVLQPNLKIPFYLVAPDGHKKEAIAEVNRLTYHRLSLPLSQACRFISFATVREQMRLVAPLHRRFSHEYLADISESCEIDEV